MLHCHGHLLGGSGLLSGIGALILSGPMTYGVAYVFLKQSRDGQPMNVADVFRGFPEDSAARCCWAC